MAFELLLRWKAARRPESGAVPLWKDVAAHGQRHQALKKTAPAGGRNSGCKEALRGNVASALDRLSCGCVKAAKGAIVLGLFDFQSAAMGSRIKAAANAPLPRGRCPAWQPDLESHKALDNEKSGIQNAKN